MIDIDDGVFSDRVMDQLLEVSQDELAADRIMEDFQDQEDQVSAVDGGGRRELFSAQYVFQLAVAIDRINQQIKMIQEEQIVDPYSYYDYDQF